ncbi:MAG: TadE/TadG family type IV pilus assembly protein [Xanthobacteraceae bacterium]
MTRRAIETLHRLNSRLAALGRDARGLAAVEFAMILPLMLVTLFGVIGTTTVLSIDRKVTMIARTMSDLVSQSDAVSSADIDNFYAVGRAILYPYSPAQNPVSGGPLWMRVSELYVNPASGQVRVQWSEVRGTKADGEDDDPLTVGNQVAMPNDLIGRAADNTILPNQYFILSEVDYLYAPAILPGVVSVPLREKTYTRPRVTSRQFCVLYAGATTCPTN